MQIGASFKLFVSRRGDGFSAQFTAHHARGVELLMTRKADTTNESFDGWQLFQAKLSVRKRVRREAIGLGGHDEVVTVQAANFVRPPGDGDAAPLR